MISGLWANTNLDDDKGTRTTRLREIEASFENAMAIVYGHEQAREEINKEDPFFKAMKAPEKAPEGSLPDGFQNDPQEGLEVRVEVD